MELQAVDKKKSTEGVWAEHSPGFYIKIAMLGNPRYQARIDRLSAPYVRRGGHNTRALLRAAKEAASHDLVLGWGSEANGQTEAFTGQTIEDATDLIVDGEVVPYSPDNALRIFLDDRFPHFYVQCLEIAQCEALFHQATTTETAGNS